MTCLKTSVMLGLSRMLGIGGFDVLDFSDGTTQDTAGIVPAGLILPYGGSSAPTGWLLCDGTTGKDSVVDTSLADLFAIIGTTFGGTGANDFDLPDMRGNLPLGKDNMGGSSRDRVTDSQSNRVTE